jgi:hypothetical protein
MQHNLKANIILLYRAYQEKVIEMQWVKTLQAYDILITADHIMN